MSHARPRRGLVRLMLVALFAAGCTAGGGQATWTEGPAPTGVVLGIAAAPSTPAPATAAPAAPSALHAEEAEFSIKLDGATLAAGASSIVVANKGTITHEFVVVRTDLAPETLPRGTDGGVDEDNSGTTHIDEAEDIAPGTSKTIDLQLTPGAYVVFCNLPGHYVGGMHAAFTVVARPA